jgi:S-adenosylmethionine:tRNA ribosyltransferase-isomerase
VVPLDEPYRIPISTAALIEACKRQGGRVIAIGTTVVRALEDAARDDGTVAPGFGTATQRIGPLTPLRCVDAIVSGMHEPGTSHYELLRAFQDDDVLRRMERDANVRGYRTHEFGDSIWLERADQASLSLSIESQSMRCARLSSGARRGDDRQHASCEATR